MHQQPLRKDWHCHLYSNVRTIRRCDCYEERMTPPIVSTPIWMEIMREGLLDCACTPQFHGRNHNLGVSTSIGRHDRL